MRPARPRSVMFDGPSVVVSGRFAAWLESQVNLRRLALDVRGSDPELVEALHAIHLASLTWQEQVSGSAYGTRADNPAELPARLEPMTTTAAANVLGMTERGIRKACVAGRLAAQQVGGRWVIDRDDIDRFSEARTP